MRPKCGSVGTTQFKNTVNVSVLTFLLNKQFLGLPYSSFSEFNLSCLKLLGCDENEDDEGLFCFLFFRSWLYGSVQRN